MQTNSPAKYITRSTLFCVVFTLLLILFSFAKGFFPGNLERLAHGILGTMAAFLATILFLRFDKKRFSDIGLTLQRKTILRFFTGVAAGIVLMGILATSVIYFSDAKVLVNPEGSIWSFILVTLPLVPLAFMEELGFRAYPLEILKDKVGIRMAILVTSVLFALYHVANGWSIASSFYGPGVWGLIFGLAAIYSKGIAMPTGIHYAANLTTSAFAAKNDKGTLWIVEQPGNTELKQGGTDWATLLPALALLVFAIIFIEFYRRRIRSPKIAHDKTVMIE